MYPYIIYLLTQFWDKIDSHVMHLLIFTNLTFEEEIFTSLSFMRATGEPLLDSFSNSWASWKNDLRNRTKEIFHEGYVCVSYNVSIA